MPENVEFEKIAGCFSNLEYLIIRRKPTKEFISKFLSKLPNLKYFSINRYDFEFHETVDLIKENFPYPIEKRKFKTQARTFLNGSNRNCIKISIRSPNVISEWRDFPKLLYVKKLIKKGDSFTPKYFAYDNQYSIEKNEPYSSSQSLLQLFDTLRI